LDNLVKAFYLKRVRPKFNFSYIRPKGALLVTSGARAPGPEPLRKMLLSVEEKLNDAVGRQLTDIEIHDINCIISDCVLAGGIRRAAMISLFDRDSEQMLSAKQGTWWEKYPYRARANNSAVLPRGETTYEEFNYIYKKCIDSNSGEPGLFWTNDVDFGMNPCSEISLNSNQFCNLTTINLTGVKDKRDSLNRVYSASLIGTLQASYTEFPFIRDVWRKTTEKEALLGVSFTGIADNNMGYVPAPWLQEGAKLVKDVNLSYSKKIGINPAARTTTIKPEGTASTVLGSSSGIHARHSEFYLRRVRMNKDDTLSKYLTASIPELVEDDLFSTNGIVVTLPQKSPEGSLVRTDEGALELFNRVLFYHENWVKPGHGYGSNTHNVSVTISYKPSEIDSLGKALWENRLNYTGISLLPFDNSSHKQMPFEECDKMTYDKYVTLVKDIDLRNVREDEDNTTRIEALACAGGVCTL